MNYITNVTRSKGDPQILSSGVSSLSSGNRLGRALGWFSLAIGLAELITPRWLAQTLGMRRQETLLRAYGTREIAAGIMALSPDRKLALWSRVAGDGLDLATLLAACRADNPKRGNVGLAIGLVLGVTALDLLAAASLSRQHARDGNVRSYHDRSGFPRGIRQIAGAATTAK